MDADPFITQVVTIFTLLETFIVLNDIRKLAGLTNSNLVRSVALIAEKYASIPLEVLIPLTKNWKTNFIDCILSKFITTFIYTLVIFLVLISWTVKWTNLLSTYD